MKDQKKVTMPDMPANWEDCSRDELHWLAENGTYGQRLIAQRWLASKPTETKRKFED